MFYKNRQRIRFVSQGRQKVTGAPVYKWHRSGRKENTSDLSAGCGKLSELVV